MFLACCIRAQKSPLPTPSASGRKVTGCSIPHVGHRGITLGQLRTFARKARRQMAKLHPKTPWDHFTVAQICDLVVKKASQNGWEKGGARHGEWGIPSPYLVVGVCLVMGEGINTDTAGYWYREYRISIQSECIVYGMYMECADMKLYEQTGVSNPKHGF